MPKSDKTKVFQIPIPRATLVAISPDATRLLSYHPPFLHLHNRATPTHRFRWKASRKVTSVTALSLNDCAFFGTLDGSLFCAGQTLKPRLVATLADRIVAVSHTKSFFAAATPTTLFVIHGKKIVYRLNDVRVSAMSLAEWHAIGEIARSASLAYVVGGKVTYIPDLSDGCEGVRSVENVKSVYLHQGPSKDFLYVLGNRLRVYEVDMTGKLRRSESFHVSGHNCAEWIQEKGRRAIVVASMERRMIKITTTRIPKHVRFRGEQ